MEKFYSNGKLLISGEYLVLDKAIALALPTNYGQFLEVEEVNTQYLDWNSFNVENNQWFSARFDCNTLAVLACSNQQVATTLQEILQTAKNLNPSFLNYNKGLIVTTRLTFPNQWGLGTSSTLINNIATWANVNAFELLEKSFGGSGYDIACAANDTAITYQRNGIKPIVSEVNFNPVFKEQLHFVYLNIKQDSKEGIKMYRSLNVDKTSFYDVVNNITAQMIKAKTLVEFEELINQHELLIGRLLNIKPIGERLFADFTGSVKSLGAWGGDFVMVTGDELAVKKYFTPKGFNTILSFDKMILNGKD